MPEYYCKHCRCVNYVPPEAVEFTCKICETKQEVPSVEEQVVSKALEHTVFKEPTLAGTASAENIVFDEIAQMEDKQLYSGDSEEESEADRIVRCNSVYYKAVSKMGGENINYYLKAIEELESIRGWKDADALIEECQEKIRSLQEREESLRQQAEQRQKQRKKKTILTAVIVIVVPVLLLIFFVFLLPASRYNKATADLKAGNIVSAYESYESLKSYKDSAEKAQELFKEYKTAKLKVADIGDTVYLGTYRQVGDSEKDIDDIAWKVLDKKDGQLLLISVYILDCRPYHSEIAVTWQKSDMREWLNTHFLNDAFDAQQQSMLVAKENPADENTTYHINPGNATTDRVFLLSAKEAEQYFSNDARRRALPTRYSGIHGIYRSVKNYLIGKTSMWFLRTPGFDETMVSIVQYDGSVSYYGTSAASNNVGVRPAVWVQP